MSLIQGLLSAQTREAFWTESGEGEGGGGFGRRRGGKGGFGRGVCPVYRGALCPNHSSEVPTVIRPQVHTTMHSM